MCSSSEREKERKREQSAKKLEEREKERERGVKPRHPHPMGHPPLKKELILIRFFIWVTPRFFTLAIFSSLGCRDRQARPRWHDRDGISVSIATLYLVRSFPRPSVSPLVRSVRGTSAATNYPSLIPRHRRIEPRLIQGCKERQRVEKKSRYAPMPCSL